MRYIRINIHVHLRVRNRVVLFSSILLSFFLATTMTTSTLVKYRSPGFNRMCCFFLIIAYIFSFFFVFVIFFLFPPLTSTFNIFSYYSSKSSRRRHFNMLFTFQIRIMLSTLPFFVLLFHLLFSLFLFILAVFFCVSYYLKSFVVVTVFFSPFMLSFGALLCVSAGRTRWIVI